MSESNVIALGLKAVTARGPWVEHGACRTSSLGPDAWFPEVGQTESSTTVAALRVCRRDCPVAVECLVHALGAGERHGIWGGMTPGQRALFARKVRERRAVRKGTAA